MALGKHIADRMGQRGNMALAEMEVVLMKTPTTQLEKEQEDQESVASVIRLAMAEGAVRKLQTMLMAMTLLMLMSTGRCTG